MTQTDKVNSRGSPGPDGAHTGVSRELEDEADKQQVRKFYKTVLMCCVSNRDICEDKNTVSLENKTK